MTALAARGIRKSFGRRQVLTGVDLEVAAGELVAVVGENGTGKTTLLRILAGDLRPDAGSVAIDGRPGYCPQTVVLDEALTVDQNVRYFQAAYGIGGTGRAGELIERLGYAGCRGRHPVRRDQGRLRPARPGRAAAADAPARPRGGTGWHPIDRHTINQPAPSDADGGRRADKRRSRSQPG